MGRVPSSLSGMMMAMLLLGLVGLKWHASVSPRWLMCSEVGKVCLGMVLVCSRLLRAYLRLRWCLVLRAPH